MKMKYRALSVLLCTAVLFACLSAPSASSDFTQTNANPTIKKINPLSTATPVPFPENVTAMPLDGKPGKVTPLPYRPTLPPIPDKFTAQTPTAVPTATPSAPPPSIHISTAPPTATPTIKPVKPTATPTIKPTATRPSSKPGKAPTDTIAVKPVVTPGRLPPRPTFMQTAAPTRTPDGPIIDTLHAEAISSTSIRLRWDGNDESADGFIIVRTHDFETMSTFIVSETNWTDTDLDEDTAYYYTVAYRYRNGNTWESGPQSSITLCITLMPAPWGLSAQPSAFETILSWGKLDRASGYIVYGLDETQAGFHEIMRVNEERAITITPPNGRSYDYRVSAFNLWGEGDLSSEISVMGNSRLPLRAPAWLRAAPTSDARVYTLSWEPVPGANRYYIYTDRNNTGETTIGPVTAAQCSTGELLFGSTYECYIRAANETVYGRGSETVTIEIPPAENPSLQAPNLYSGESLSSSSAKLSWHSVSGAQRYQVYFANGNFITEVNTTSYTVERLEPSNRYSFKVRAMDAQNAAGPFSNPREVMTKAGYLAPPWIDLRSSDTGYVVLEWEPCRMNNNGQEIEPPQSYNIYRTEEGSSAYEKIRTVPGQSQLSYFSAVDHNVQPGKRYGYYIRAYSDRYGEGYYNEKYIKAALTAPTGFRAIVLSPTRIRLDWNAEEAAVSYIVTLPEFTSPGVQSTVRVDEPFYVHRLTDNQNNIASFRVTYFDHDDDLSRAAWISVRMKLAAPQGLTARALDSSRIQLSWQRVDGAESYNVYRCETPNGDYELVGHSTADMNLEANKVYYYKVSAVNGAGPGDLSNMASASTGIAVPQNLVASSVSSSKIYLTWNAVSGAEAYDVYRSDTSDGIHGVIKRVTGLSTSDEGLLPYTRHSYKVAAVINDQTGEASAPAVARTRVAAPQGLNAIALDSSRVQLSCLSVEGAESYNVYRTTLTGKAYRLVGQSMTDTGLEADTVYYYKVAGVNGDGPGDLSSAVSVRTGIAAPQNLVVKSVSSSKIHLTWNAVLGAEAYDVYRSDTSDGIHGVIRRVTDHSMSDEGLLPNTFHSYKVAAVIGGRVADASAPAVARTRVAAPQGLNAIALDSSRVQLSCLSVEGAESYNVYRTTFQGKAYRLIGQSMTDTGLEADTLYYYKVAGVNGDGPGDLSSVVSVHTKIAVPQNLVAASISESEIGLSWSAVPGVQAYDVYRSDTSDGIHGVIKRVTGTSTSDEGLLPNTLHSYKVAAVIGGRVGESSAPAVARTRVAAPDGLSALALGGAGIWLMWQQVDGAQSYTVYRSITSNGGFEPVGYPTSRQFTDSGLQHGTTYYYFVTASNQWGESAKSSQVFARTRP